MENTLWQVSIVTNNQEGSCISNALLCFLLYSCPAITCPSRLPKAAISSGIQVLLMIMHFTVMSFRSGEGDMAW